MFLRKKKKNGLDKEKKDRNSFDEEPEVDSEGYTIRKSVDNYNQKNLDKFYSSSDESDSERDGEKKLHFEIKPRNGFDPKNSSVDELKQTVKQLSIAPPSNTQKRQISYFDGTLKRSTSQNVINLNTNNQRLSNFRKNANYNSSLSNLHSTFNHNNQLSKGELDLTDQKINLNSNTSISKPNSSTPINSTPNASSINSSSNTSNNVPTVNNASIINTFSDTSSNNINNSSSNIQPPQQQPPTEDRCAALRAFFDNESTGNELSKDDALLFNQESNLIKSTSLSKSISSFSANSSSLFKENSSTKDLNQLINGNRKSSNHISRCESYSSLSNDLRMTPVSICSSRGPSPLTLGSSIPIAAAIQECVSARFKGSNENKCTSAIYGILKIAFPTGILQILMNQPLLNVLAFKLVNTTRISKIHCNKEVILSYKKNANNNEIHFEIKMDGLIQSLKQSFEKSPAARYFNVDILKYQLDSVTGTQSCPLQVVTHWKCEPQTTCLKIDYKYNPYALSSLEPLRNVTFSVEVDNVLDFQSKPQANWNSSTKQICWKIDQISRLSEGCGLGSLRAKFSVDKGPTSPTPVLIQLHCANSTFSGINFELLTSAYRCSVIKKQCSAGKYISEADSSISYVSV